ncbi:MAG: SHOCT domain-containing protein [Chloroflexota bacterium]|nr:SHOCT domain-containing protein [Chloroflexota bacterium]
MDFAEVEREVAKLRQRLAAGRLTEEQFKARLRELMVLDEHGDWWMVGYETGEWYCHDGTDWMRADPSGGTNRRAIPQPMTQPVAPIKPEPPQFWARSSPMAQGVWETNEVEAIVSGISTTRHRLQTAAGTLGEFTFPALRTSGIFRAADGRELVVRRTNLWRDRHELRAGETVLGTARLRSAFRREIVIQFAGWEYALKPSGLQTRHWHLTDETGTTLVDIRPRGVFRRGGYLMIQNPVDTDLLIFAYYLVHTREEAAS